MEQKTRSVSDIIENLQKQIDELKGASMPSFPWKPGDKVLMPADETGKRMIRIVPNSDLAVENLGLILGIELYDGEVPACGFIIDKRVHKTFVASEPEKDPNAPPEDFAHNKPKPMTETEQTAAAVAAIFTLKAEDFTGGTGFPKVASLSKAVGFDIQTVIRDAAWTVFKKNNPEWTPDE